MKILSLDYSSVHSQLKAVARKLKDNQNVSRVLLFGSLIHGNYTAASDADLLIILKSDTRRWFDRIPEYLAYFDNFPLDVDLFPYTQDEIDKAIKNRNLFFEQMLREGIEL